MNSTKYKKISGGINVSSLNQLENNIKNKENTVYC